MFYYFFFFHLFVFVRHFSFLLIFHVRCCIGFITFFVYFHLVFFSFHSFVSVGNFSFLLILHAIGLCVCLFLLCGCWLVVRVFMALNVFFFCDQLINSKRKDLCYYRTSIIFSLLSIIYIRNLYFLFHT